MDYVWKAFYQEFIISIMKLCFDAWETLHKLKHSLYYCIEKKYGGDTRNAV